MVSFIKALILCIPFVFTSASGLTQNDASPDHSRPKIGLVLSGGGAKGIAHIGILKAMEQEGLRPDYITGTSMGSIIGGLYALGYSADQLDSIIRSVNWDMVLSNNIPFNYIAYEEKEYYNRYLAEFQLENGKLKLPSGLIEGQILSEQLTRFTWPAVRYQSFDDFPIPFRCVATDVSTGNPIVFKEGSLAKAIRSSMAIPTAFTAVDLDTTLAVDGGVVENFPVDEVVNMGADIIIGVSVGDGMKSAYELDGMTGILFQVSMIPSLTKMDDQIEKCDIYIRPDLLDYGTGSFSKYDEILELGYTAGEKNRPAFRELAQKLGMQSKPIKKLNVTGLKYQVGKIEIKGNKLVDDELILSKLNVEIGDWVTFDDIEHGIRAIYGTTDFAKVTTELTPIDGTDSYLLTLITKVKNPVLVKSSFHYDNIFSAGIMLNLTLRNLLGQSSRTIFIGDISKNPKFRLDYLKYIGKHQNMAVNATYNYLNQQIPTYEKGKLKDIEVSYENSFTLGFITTQSLRHSFYLGVEYRFVNQKFKFKNSVPEGLKNGEFNLGKINFNYQSNTLNDRNYPTSGKELAVLGHFNFSSNYRVKYDKNVDTVYFPIDIEGTIIEYPISEEDLNDIIIKPATPESYGTFSIRYKQYVNLNPHFQVIPLAAMSFIFSNSPSSSIFYNYRIGGFQHVKFSDVPFVGLHTYEVDYNNFLIGGLFFQNIVLKNIYLTYGANLLLPHDYVPLNELESFSTYQLMDESLLGYGTKITYKSILGPVNFGLSSNTLDGRFRYYFSIGFSFNYSD
ncbi:MAG: patatin-like phospholipase family protein [Bacteroidetes bacterium]|nr:patatin-like phospholipase family protein [Bacteroidota bacterium]